MDERAPDPRPQTRVAWEHDEGVESEPELEFNLGPLDMVWFGVVLAAAFYPTVIGALVLLFSTLAFGFAGVSLDAILMAAVFVMFSFVVGLIYGALMSIPAFFLTQLLRWSFKGIISERGICGAYGGMTGFLCTSGGGLFITNGMPPLQDWEQWTTAILVSLLAVVMGYAGAVWFGYRKRNKGFPFFEPIFSFEKQITIGYLMKLTFIVAALCVGLKSAGMAGFYIGFAWSLYLLAQTLLLVCDHWLTRWLKGRPLSPPHLK